MYSVCVSEGDLHAGAIVHPSPPFGGGKLPFAWWKRGKDSSILRWIMTPILFVDDEGRNTAIHRRERLITDAYDVFFCLLGLLVSQDPGGDVRRLRPFIVFTSLSLVFAPPPRLTS